MRKVLKNTAKTKKRLDKLPKIYVVFLWAKYTVIETVWTGKFRCGIPLVYTYYDFNGEYDEYRLMPVYHISSGGFVGWYSNKGVAESICKKLNGETN